MRHWAIVVTEERLAAERLYAHDTLDLSALGEAGLRPGDAVVLVSTSGPKSVPAIFGLGVCRARHGSHVDADDPDEPDPDEPDLVVAYTHRLLDEPMEAPELGPARPGPVPLDETGHARLAGRVAAASRVDADKSDWLVSVALPIEAASPAEAVRAFWSYVDELGPRELPAFVSPTHDELAMRAYVLGEPANLDPEEDD
jgi:hypothetical protein